MSRALHHLDLWVSDPDVAKAEWGWLLGEVGWVVDGPAWAHSDGLYIFIERSSDQVDSPHDRLRPGVNHLAFLIDDRDLLDRIRAEAGSHGWSELFADRYPYAGGPDMVALYLENSEGFEAEIVVEP